MAVQLKFELYEVELISPLAGRELTKLEKYVASLLLDATAAAPIGIADIIRRADAALEIHLTARSVKDTVRTLRKEHKFPVLARRNSPAGYWWCSSLEEMQEFVESYRSQALDELHTLSQMVKHNYPAIAGQLSFTE
jgi:hypothetical protein